MVIWCSCRYVGDAQQRRGEAGVGGGVAAPGGGAGHRVGPHRRRRTGTPAARATLPRTRRRGRRSTTGRPSPQPLQHGGRADGGVGGDADLPGQHHLLEGAADDGLGGAVDQLAPPLGRQHRLDGELATAPAAVGRAPKARARARSSCSSGAVLGPAPHDRRAPPASRRPTPPGRRAGPRRPPARSRAAPPRRPARSPARKRIGLGHRHGGGDAPAGQPDPAPLEDHAVAAGHVQQVDVAVDPAGRGDERVTIRVPVSSWEMPPLSSVRSTSGNPAPRDQRHERRGLRQVGDRLGQVAVGVAVGQQGADAGHDLAEVERVAPRAGTGWAARPPRGGRCGRRGAPPGPPRRGTAPTSTKLRRAKPQVTPSTDAVGQGQAQGVAVDQRAPRAGGGQHPEATGRRRSAATRPPPAPGTGRRCRRPGRAPSSPAAGPASAPTGARQRTSRRNVMIRLTRS